jgi:hypothetical protein
MAKLIRPQAKYPEREGNLDVTEPGSRTFDFRLRFNMVKGDHIRSESQELQLMRTLDGKVIRLRAGSRRTQIKDSSEIAIIGGPYSSPEEAGTMATRVRQAVLIWAVRQKLGLDFGDGFLRKFLTDYGKKFYEQEFSRPIRNDRLGIDVYESQKDLLFASREVTMALGKHADTFAEQVCQQVAQPLPLNEKQIIAAELYSASFFDVPFRSRFITLVTSIEALLVPERRADEIQSFIDGVKRDLKGREVDEVTKEALMGSLERLRSDSIGQTGRILCERLLPHKEYGGRSAGKFFKYCYDLRSEIVHSGKPSKDEVDLLQLGNVCQAFVGDLLLASFGLQNSD